VVAVNVVRLACWNAPVLSSATLNTSDQAGTVCPALFLSDRHSIEARF
jgi:hypothetical protein